MGATILAVTKDIAREEWLELRKKGIGGSDVGAICGVNKWKSAVAVYLEKVGELEKEDIQSEAAYWGNTLEEVVAKEFEKRTGKKVKRRNALLQSPKYPFMLANVDRLLVGEKAGLECKTVNEYGKNEWMGEEIPESYILQCYHYMIVTGLKKWYIACLIGGNKFIWKEINYDEEFANALIEIEKEFWDRVEKRIPPVMDGSESSSEVLKILYPNAKEGSKIALPFETETMINEVIQIELKLKELNDKKSEIDNRIKAILEDNEQGETKSFLVSYKNQTRTTVDSKKLKEEMPEIYKKYINVSSFRKFNIKRKEEN